MQRLLTHFCLGCVLALASPAWAGEKGAGGASGQATAPGELKQLRSRIEALQKELAASEESKTEAEDALRESERAISDTNRKLMELAQQQREANGALAQLEAQTGRLQASIRSQQELLGKLLYQQYLGGRQDYLKLLLNRQDPNQIARDLHYYSYISRARAQWLKSLRDDLSSMGEVLRRTQEQSAELAAIQAEQTAQKQRLEREKAARKTVLATVSRDITRQRREIGKLRRDENRLAKLVQKLGRMLARKESPTLLRNTKLPDASFDGSPFKELQGRLNLPVRGELANRFGSPRSDGGLTWKGLFIRSPEGQEVKAIAAGRVVFADWLRGFGNLLIIDHGQGYMSLYGNNETLYKQVGDMLRGGETIAAVGNSGGNPDSGLYFELRHQGKPLDPMNWVTLK